MRILVIVSTTCPVTIARAAALALALSRMRGSMKRRNSTYPTSQAARITKNRQSIVENRSAAPKTEARPKTTAFTVSTTLSDSDRDACICFCAIRPA